ncbi:MAG: hypothetical protein ABI411_14470 [Tahibacter sp.]
MQNRIRPGLAGLVGTLLYASLAFLLTLRLGSPPVGDALDPSWTMVLSWAFMHGSQWGTDIVFTHGPLGFLHPLASYDPVTFRAFVVGQIALAGLGAFISASLFARLELSGKLAAAAFLYLFQAVLWADTLWIVLCASAVVSLQLTLARGGPRWFCIVLVVASAVFGATVSMIKVSLLPLAVLGWVSAVAMGVGKRNGLVATIAALAFPLALISFWMLSGQRIEGLSMHLQWVVELIKGYGSAMSAGAAIPVELGGAASLLILGALLALGAWRERRDRTQLVAIVYLASALLFAWKAGFTRADAHTMTYFGVAAWIALVVPFTGSRPRPLAAFAHAAVGCACVPLLIAGSTGVVTPSTMASSAFLHLNGLGRAMLAPERFRASRFVEWQKQSQRLALPRIRERIGGEAVDLVGNQQGIVLLNELNYRPRPAFQGYLTFSPRLAAINQAFYRGLFAPKYVMFAPAPIDEHLPSSEDALTFLEILHHYEPVLIESDIALLQRRESKSVPAPADAEPMWTNGLLDHWVDIPPEMDAGIILRLRARPSTLGMAFALLVREPSWFIELQFENGSMRRHRLVRGAVEAGFLVSPVVRSATDLSSLLAGEKLPRVVRFRICAASKRLAPLFATNYRYELLNAGIGTPIPFPAKGR